MEKPRKLLVRSWLPGRGCVHFRSDTMSEAEAREVLESARDAIEKAQESGGIEQIAVAGGRAFVRARRLPDPDHPNRMAPGFVLVFIPEGEVDELIRSEAGELIRARAGKILDGVPHSSGKATLVCKT